MEETAMKSAYHHVVPQEDVRLTHVERGSPMGELLRRYWQPVALSSELGDLPKKVKILCEEVVLFRTRAGDVGALEPHCSHRGTSLEYGRIEENGIRCCYHGWLYNTEGRVTEMICEPAGFCERAAIEHPAYPVLEFGGLVFLYMGPPEKKPPFPLYDVYDLRGRTDAVLRGMQLWEGQGVGYVQNCNWLQAHENVMDPWHLLVLHQMISGDQFNGALMQGRTDISWERTTLGTRYKVIKDLPNGNRMVRYAECVLPNAYLIPSIHETGQSPKRKSLPTEFSWTVPVDNERIAGFSLVAWPAVDGQPVEDWLAGTDVRIDKRPGHGIGRTYEEQQRKPDDAEAQESQRPIAVHALEHLANSDRGIIMLRRALREQVEKVERGEDPDNVWRDSRETISTNAWNTILSPAEAKVHQGEEA